MTTTPDDYTNDPQIILKAYARDRLRTTLAAPWSLNVANANADAHMVTTRLDPAGKFDMLKVKIAMGSTTDGTITFSNSYCTTALTVTEAASLVTQANDIDQQASAVFTKVANQIHANVDLISQDQIDTAFAAVKAN